MALFLCQNQTGGKSRMAKDEPNRPDEVKNGPETEQAAPAQEETPAPEMSAEEMAALAGEQVKAYSEVSMAHYRGIFKKIAAYLANLSR
jgi:hypothetical protein